MKTHKNTKHGVLLLILVSSILMPAYSMHSFTSRAQQLFSSKFVPLIAGVLASVTHLSFSPRTVKAETIFYRENGTPITEEEHKIIYDIKLRNQFPMCVTSGSCPKDEVAAMQTELDKKVQGVTVQFIPTTVYELFFLHFHDANEKHLYEWFSGILNKRKHGLYPKSYYGKFEKSELDFEGLNKDPNIKECHRALNNYIASYLGDDNEASLIKRLISHNERSSDEDRKKLAEQLKASDFLHKARTDNLMQHEPSFIIKTVALETQAHQAGNHLFYRGTAQLDSYQENQPPTSLSFGSSWFGGVLFDRGAMAFEHRYNKRFGYVLPICKESYMNGNMRKMFHIPPLIGLVQLTGHAEFFHPRTKIPAIDVLTQGFSLQGTFYIPSYYQIDGKIPEEREQIYKEIFAFIKKNHIKV